MQFACLHYKHNTFFLSMARWNKKEISTIFFCRWGNWGPEKLRDSLAWWSAPTTTEPHFLPGPRCLERPHASPAPAPNLHSLSVTCWKPTQTLKPTSMSFTASTAIQKLALSSEFLQQAGSSLMGTHHSTKLQRRVLSSWPPPAPKHY